MASASVLAEQPADPKPRKWNQMEQKEWNALRGHGDVRISNLRTWRSSWWITNWSDLAEFILPRRSTWLTQSAGGIPSPNNMSRGLEINQSIVDPTGTYAARICVGGLVSGLASQSRPWFAMVPAIKDVDLDAEGRVWIDTTQERIYTILALSNFYQSFTVKCEDVVVFGTGVRIIYEDAETVLHCYNPAIGEFFLANAATNRHNCLARQFLMTIAQIVDFFGVDNCPQDVQKMWAQKGAALDTERIISHLIEPNFGVDAGDGHKTAGVIPGNFAWREMYWVYGSGGSGPLSLRGFNEKPFTASLWSQQSNDAYGRGPGMDTLPDILQLQVETQRKAEAIEKMVRPPLVADMTMKNQPSSSIPGSVTFVPKLGPETGMKPMYEVNPDIKAISQDLAEIQQRIRVGFFNDLFMALSQNATDPESNKITAYQSAAIVNERLQVIGPVIEGMLGDLKDELKRVYSICQRKGLIDPPPKSLHGVPLTIEFVSLLALAAKAAATGGIERLFQFAGNLVEAYPEIKFVVDAQQGIREMADLLGVPKKIVRGQKESTALQQQAAQQAQRASQMAALQHSAQTANVASSAAQNLSQTQIGGGKTAFDILSQQGQAGS